jgi:hypothetical protein
MIDRANEGRRVELIQTNDQYTKLRPGDRGTYEMCLKQPDGQHQHCIKWDSGSTLILLEGVDSFKFVDEDGEEMDKETRRPDAIRRRA